MKQLLKSAAPWQYHGDPVWNLRAPTDDFWQNQETLPHSFSSYFQGPLLQKQVIPCLTFGMPSVCTKVQGAILSGKAQAQDTLWKETWKCLIPGNARNRVKVQWAICTVASSLEKIHFACNLYFALLAMEVILAFLESSVISSPPPGKSRISRWVQGAWEGL